MVNPSKGHYKKLITTLDEDLSIRGKYMSIKLTNFLFNILLKPSHPLYANFNPLIFNLVEFIYHNIWIARISFWAEDKISVIDSDGFQHPLIGTSLDPLIYTKCILKDGVARDVCFPHLNLTLESKAKVKGWWWLRPLKGDVVPLRFILRFDIFKPGEISGRVQDSETLEFEFKNAELILQFANSSYERFLKREIGQPLG